MESTLGIGESMTVKRSFFGKGWSVVYAGMPNEDTYALAVTWTFGYSSAAYNLFVAREQREVSLAGGRLNVISVSPREIRLSYQK